MSNIASKESTEVEVFDIRIDETTLVLAHLEGFDEFRGEDEVPYPMTPRGITEAVGISESEPYDTLEKIEDEGLIKKDRRNILGLERERNVYLITEKGLTKIYDRWDKIKDEVVTIKTEEEEKEIPFKEVRKQLSGRNPITKALHLIDENKVIDLTCIEDEVEVFVGRKEELDRLKKHLSEVKDSGSKTVLVKGEAGIGKTSLVSRLKPFAQEMGFEFLVGICQSQTSDPYLPFKEAFTDYIKGDKVRHESAGMSFIGTEQEEVLEDKKLFDARKSETFYETKESVREISERIPLVVFLDDLQWADKGTLDILAYMDDKLDDDPILFIGAYRPEEVDESHPLMEMIHRLGSEARIERIAEELQDDELMAQAYHDLGTFLKTHENEYEKAEKYLEKAKEIWDDLGNLKKLSSTLNNLSNVYLWKGELEKAIEQYEKCLEAYEEIGDKTNTVIVYNNLGESHRRRGELDTAFEKFKEALNISEQINNKFQKGHLYMNIGLTHLDGEELERAVDCFKRGLELAKEVEYLDNKIRINYYLGKAEIKRENIEGAEKYLAVLKEHSSDRDIERDEGLINLLEGSISGKKEEFDQSAKLLEKAIDIFEETNSQEKEAKALYELGLVCQKKGDKERANKILRKALDYFKSMKMDLWANKTKDLFEEKSSRQ